MSGPGPGPDPAAAPDGRCPCGTGRPYSVCCGRLHRGEADAATAEQLMRSRYSAFVRLDADYLRRSWHPTTRPRRVRLDPDRQWVGLQILGTRAGGLVDDEGWVEFRAHHERDGRTDVLHENSRFARVDSRWVYVGAAPTA